MQPTNSWKTLLIGTLLLPIASWAVAQTPNSKKADTPAATEATAFFETHIRPLLVTKCFSCHSVKSRTLQGGLRLDSREGILKGGKHGSAIVVGDPEHSLLMLAVMSTDTASQMPPGNRLKPAEIATLSQWIKSGAVWANDRTHPQPAALPNKPFWAFLPPKSPVLPQVSKREWMQNPIDRLILAQLDKKGLKPVPPTDKRTLLRRATFDLTGLPPTPKEVQEFLADTKPNAFERVIDRLLASPAYGERWGRHWLDVARYADSNGLDENLVFPQAWRYRDYVVRAFNQDKPIHRFIQEQIAGDLLPPATNSETSFDPIIATGYLSLGPKMLAEDDPVKQEMDIIDEQIDTLGKTFLGITIGCARCHDHKFDPFPTTDYYALAGIFKSTKTMNKFQVVAEWQERPLGSPTEQESLKTFEKKLKEKKQAAERIRKAEGDIVLAAQNKRGADYLRVATQIVKAEASAKLLNPILSTPETPLPSGAIQVEAEDFVRGNVLKDRSGFGKGIGVLVNAGEYPNRTEYEITPPTEGLYQLDVRYASNDPRPIRIYVNNALVASNAAGNVTGGFYPEAQKWFAEGVFALHNGKNLIRFERDSYFPHIDKFLLTKSTHSATPHTTEQLAKEAGLLPEFVSLAAEQVRGAGKTPLFEVVFELPPNPDRLFPPKAQAELKALDEAIADLQKRKPNLPRTMAVSEGVPTNLKVHLRGNYLTLGTECARRFPAVIAGENPPSISSSQSGRLELAQWLTQPNHPLTSRVFVNRVWRWHFGKGIVGSTDNFGALGEKPSNQALLDWLATTFVADGWSLKKLHKRIMLSQTYQIGTQTSPKAALLDPENRLLSHFSRRRLEAEAIRDSILAVSGKLDTTQGGSLLSLKDREYVTSTANSDPVNYRSLRRSLYLPVVRSALYDVYTAFDFGDPSVMNGDRSSTTVAPQALFMMNSPLVLEQSKAMAEQILAHTELDDRGKVEFAYLLCYARPPKPAEIQRFTAGLERLEKAYTALEPKPEARRLRVWQSLCKTWIAANEFIFVD